jgi:predicted PurR-regulated permease PerM
MNSDPEQLPPLNGQEVRSVMITGLFVLALFYTLYLARDFVLPIILALLLSFLLSPAVRGLKKIRIREEIGAAFILVALVGGLTFVFYQFSGPASRWIAEAPATLQRIETDIRQLRQPMQKVTRAAEQVERIAGLGASQDVQQVEIRKPTLSETVFSGTRSAVAGFVVSMLLLYFLLASGDLFLLKLVRVLPTLSDRKTAVEIATRMERQVSVYLVSVTGINTALGVVQGLAMYLVGLPNPALWGLMAAVLNFVPYLGAIVGVMVISLVGYMHFGELSGALIPAGVYLGITALEGGVFTPILLAKRLTLNPVMLLIGVIFWGWLWGLPGALLAVPLMSTIKILCDHIAPLAPIGEFLGR